MMSFRVTKRFLKQVSVPQLLVRHPRGIPFSQNNITRSDSILKLNNPLSPCQTPNHKFEPAAVEHARRYSVNYEDYDRLSLATVGLLSIYSCESGPFHQSGTGIFISKPNSNKNPKLLTAYHNIYPFMNDEMQNTEEKSAVWKKEGNFIFRSGFDQTNISHGYAFFDDTILWADESSDLALLDIAGMSFNTGYMEIEDGYDIDPNKVETLVMCSVNPPDYPRSEKSQQGSKWVPPSLDSVMAHKEYSYDEYRSLYGANGDKVLMFSHKSLMAHKIYDEYIKEVENNGYKFNLYNKLLAQSEQEECCWNTLLCGITGHSGSGVSRSPGKIFSIYTADWKTTKSGIAPEMLVSKIPKKVIEEYL